MACNCKQAQPVLRPSTALVHRTLTATSLLGGLLSSSCCILQLLLNAVNFGCAGFAVLTHWSAHFRTLTIVSLGHLLYRTGFTRRSLLTVALSLGLMFSQDAVRYYNLNLGTGRPPAPPPPWTADPNSTAAPASSGPSQPSRPVTPIPEVPKPSSAGSAPSAVPSDALLDTRSTDQNAGGPRQGAGRSLAQGADDHDQSPARSVPVNAYRAVQGGGYQELKGPSKSAHERLFVGGAEEAAPTTTGGIDAGIAAVASSSGAGGAVAASAAAAADRSPRLAYLRFRVDGIKCEGCAARLKAALLRQPGVERCAVDFASKIVLVWARMGSGAGGVTEVAGAAATVRSAIQLLDLSYRPELLEGTEMT